MRRLICSLTPFYLLSVLLISPGCASGPSVRKQAYAPLQTSRTLEYALPFVWKGTLSALRNTHLVSREPEASESGDLSIRKLTRARLETDWIYSQSRDKYQEFQVNGSPRRQMLQARFKYEVVLEQVIGGTRARVDLTEEIERLRDDGSSLGYESSATPDSSRASELLDRIQQAILSANP